MRRFHRQSNGEQIKRGRGRPRKYPRANDFATLNLSDVQSSPVAAGHVSCEWTRVGDGARMRMMIVASDAAGLIEAFLGGAQ